MKEFDHVNFGVAQMEITFNQSPGFGFFFCVFFSQEVLKKSLVQKFDLLALKQISPWSFPMVEMDMPKVSNEWLKYNDWLWVFLPGCFSDCFVDLKKQVRVQLKLTLLQNYTWRIRFQNFKSFLCTTGPTSSGIKCHPCHFESTDVELPDASEPGRLIDRSL